MELVNVCLSYLRELSQLLSLLVHTSLQQHVVHHLYQLDHLQSATGPPKQTGCQRVHSATSARKQHYSLYQRLMSS